MRNALLAAVVAFAVAAPAAAADFSFTGSLSNPSEVQFFDFNVGATSNVTLRTWSYAGGVNAAGATIDRGGFDPILALFALPGGARVNENDDGGCSLVAADAVTGRCWDTFLTATLDPGAYRVSVAVFPNFATGGAFDPFEGASTFTDDSGNDRTANWAFDILNVESAVVIPGIPEPSTWAMMIAGFGLVGFAARRRRTATTVSA
jgi:hypothetical protein